MPAKAADLGDAGTAPGITAGTALLAATAAQEPPPAAIPSPTPAGDERLSLAHVALGVGTSSIGWVAVTHTFADLILAFPSRSSPWSAPPGTRRRRRP